MGRLRPRIVAGPFASEGEAAMVNMRLSFEPYEGKPGLLLYTGSTLTWRRYGAKWYILRRTEGTVHAGNRRWRATVRARRRKPTPILAMQVE